MQVIDIGVHKLRPAPWNPNTMTPEMLARLRESLVRFGLVENLVVRPVAEDAFEVLSGNQRLRVLEELGVETAPCVVVELSDAQARLLAQALNRIQGEDDPGMKAELIRHVLESVDLEDVLALLSETEDGLEELASLGIGSLEEHLQSWQGSQASRLKHFAVQLTEKQQEVVEKAIGRFLPEARALKEENLNLRGNALYLLCRGYLGHLDAQGRPV